MPEAFQLALKAVERTFWGANEKSRFVISIHRTEGVGRILHVHVEAVRGQ